MSKGKSIYDRELSESLPEVKRSISAAIAGAFQRISNVCTRFKLPLGIILCVSLAVGIIAFINWFRDPLRVRSSSAPSIEADAARMDAPEMPRDEGGDSKASSDASPSAASSAYGGTFPEIVTKGGLHIDLENDQASRSAKAIAQDVLPKLLEACPGLNDYAPDLTFVGLDDMSDPIFKESSGVGMKFKVADRPSIVPGRFLVGGHTCEYRVTTDLRTLIIQKTACASVCLEREVEHTGRDLRYPL